MVTIVIPAYNGSNYLREAIDSALAQTYRKIEIIVVNDGSTDDGKTEEIARSYGEKIRYFQKENGGVATALNLGINMMEGEYFSWLSHDDVYLPEKIECQVMHLQQISRDVILYGDYNFIDENSKHLSRKRITATHPSEFILSLLYSHPVHGCTTLIPRRAFLEVGLFDEALRTTQDYDLWFRMSKRYEFIHMPLPLINFRVHSDQGTHASRTLFLKECSEFYLNRLNEVLSNWYNCFGKVDKLCFLLKTAIFLDRCNHDKPLCYCKRELKKTIRKSFPHWCYECWYWLMYYSLFRVKRLFWR